jgi:hypothetical protein
VNNLTLNTQHLTLNIHNFYSELVEECHPELARLGSTAKSRQVEGHSTFTTKHSKFIIDNCSLNIHTVSA